MGCRNDRLFRKTEGTFHFRNNVNEGCESGDRQRCARDVKVREQLLTGFFNVLENSKHRFRENPALVEPLEFLRA
ncbi:unnamed protein product [Calypogeia fissa]